jgi:type I restriction enzyme S subunit
MRKFKILIPSDETILLFGGKVNLLNQKIQKLRQQITNLTTQRDLLIPRLMSGKLSVE